MSDCSHQLADAEAVGVVIAVDRQMLTIELEAQGCGRCHEPGGCGGQSLVQMSAGLKTYQLPNTIGASVGERVQLLIAGDLVRKAAISAYVIPLLLCIFGALVGQTLWGDLAALAGSMIGVGCGWMFINLSTTSDMTKTACIRAERIKV